MEEIKDKFCREKGMVKIIRNKIFWKNKNQGDREHII